MQAVNHPSTILARRGLISGIERDPAYYFCSKKAQKELFYLQLKRVDHSILLFINYNNLDLRLGLCTGLTKVSSFHFNSTITITYTLMLGYYLQATAD